MMSSALLSDATDVVMMSMESAARHADAAGKISAIIVGKIIGVCSRDAHSLTRSLCGQVPGPVWTVCRGIRSAEDAVSSSCHTRSGGGAGIAVVVCMDGVGSCARGVIKDSAERAIHVIAMIASNRKAIAVLWTM